MGYDQKYSDIQCEEMIKTGIIPQDAPSFVFKAVQGKKKQRDRKIKSPQKEMRDFMDELKANRRVG